ncbi:MAG TPA: hypothetical protein VHY37_09670 [Tepidisphaeraceae bacterium]|jgi:hypothetical protein|nr:hypothetical protein [Tepidisphaeraceae bacterium]
MNAKKKAVLERIKYFEEAIAKANAYLERGEYADCRGFRPLLKPKLRNGKELPPHRDWVKNWFLPNKRKALRRNEKIFGRLD